MLSVIKEIAQPHKKKQQQLNKTILGTRVASSIKTVTWNLEQNPLAFQI